MDISPIKKWSKKTKKLFNGTWNRVVSIIIRSKFYCSISMKTSFLLFFVDKGRRIPTVCLGMLFPLILKMKRSSLE